MIKSISAMTGSHHVTFGRGEPKVMHCNLAVFPSVALYSNESSVRIWGGSTETTTHMIMNYKQQD